MAQFGNHPRELAAESDRKSHKTARLPDWLVAVDLATDPRQHTRQNGLN